MNMTLLSNSRICFTLINKTSFRNRTIYNDSLSAIYYRNLNIIWSMGFNVLDISKTLILYYFHVMREYYGDDIKLFCMDTGLQFIKKIIYILYH